MQDTRDIDSHMQSIEEKIDKINKKLSEKWVLPVCLALLGAVLTLGNFFVTRYFTSKDAGKNKQKEIVGEYLAKSKIDFYKNCKKQIIEIEDDFEAYCKIGHSKSTADSLYLRLISFRSFFTEQEVIDPFIITKLKEYHEFISEEVTDIGESKLKLGDIDAIFKQGNALYNEVQEILSKQINILLKV